MINPIEPAICDKAFVPSPSRENVERVLVDTEEEFWTAVEAGKFAVLEGAYDALYGETLKDGRYWVAKRKHTGATFRKAATAKAWIAKRVPTLA